MAADHLLSCRQQCSRGAVGSAAPSHGEGRWFESSCEHLGQAWLAGLPQGCGLQVVLEPSRVAIRRSLASHRRLA